MKRGKRALALFLAALLAPLAGVVEARADYGTLIEEMEGYRPPAVVAERMTVAPAAEPATVPAQDTFKEEALRLQGEAAEWGKALTAPPATATFLTPDSARLSSLAAAASDPAVAVRALADGFTLETLETLVLLRSPAVRAKEREFTAVLEGYSQAESLDTILRRYAALTKGVMTGVGGMTNPDPVALKFPFPGVLALKGEVVGQEARAALEAVEVARRQEVTAARRAFAELGYLGQALALTRSQLELLASLQSTVSTRYEAGNTSFQTLTSLTVEREKLKEELITLGQEQENTRAEIRAALLLTEGTDIGAPAALPRPRVAPPLAALLGQALERRQEIRAQAAELAKAERMLELAETMIYPGFSQGLSLFEGDQISRVAGSGEAAMTAGGEGSLASPDSAASGLPKMPWFGTDDAFLRQTRQRIEGARQVLAETRATTCLEVRKAWTRYDQARRQVALYRERVKPLNRASLDSASQGYSAGKVEFSELIEAANGWLAVNLSLARAQADLLVAQAELEAAVGVSGAGAQ